MKKRKFYRELVAHANGAQIQFKDYFGSWVDIADDEEPAWDHKTEYRIKPEPRPEDDLKKGDLVIAWDRNKDSAILCVFTGHKEEGKLFTTSLAQGVEKPIVRWKHAELHPVQQERDEYRDALRKITNPIRTHEEVRGMANEILEKWK